MAGGVMLSTLCLNEMEWLPSLYEQHKNWPELVSWVFVESADRAYADVNPGLVSPVGLSVDGTGEFLGRLAASDPRVRYVPYGWADHPDPARGKCGPKQAGLNVAEGVKPEFYIHLDADEFYTHEHQRLIMGVMRQRPRKDAYIFNRREIWRPSGLVNQPLFRWEVVGGFWRIPCCHWWRWQPGMHHRDCHNTPTNARGYPMTRSIRDLRDYRGNRVEGMPEMVHLGFAARPEFRTAKNRYYAHRGEAKDRERRWYVESRATWEHWHPGIELPRGAKVIEYVGPVPEVFQVSESKSSGEGG